MESRAATVPSGGVLAASVEEGYLTDRDIAGRLKWATKTLETKVRQGVFKEGVHYFQRPGMRRRWKWSAVVRWLEGGEAEGRQELTIPLASPAERRVR